MMQRFSLKRRPLGDTVLPITPIGLGLAALGLEQAWSGQDTDAFSESAESY